MAETIIELARLADAETDAAGNTVRFRIEGKDGDAVTIVCDQADLEPIIHYMIQLGRLSAARRTDVTPRGFGHTDRVETSPVAVSDIGLMRGLETDEGVLVARMDGFDLGFQVTPAQLRALHAEIERVLPASMLRPSDHHHHDDTHDH